MFGLTRKDWLYCFVSAAVILVWAYFYIVTTLSIGGQETKRLNHKEKPHDRP